MNYHSQAPLQAPQFDASQFDASQFDTGLTKQRICVLDIGGMFIKGMVADIDVSDMARSAIEESMNILAMAQVNNDGIDGENLWDKKQTRTALETLLKDLQQQTDHKIDDVMICFSGATLQCDSHDFYAELPEKGYHRTEIHQWLKNQALDYLDTHQHDSDYLLHLLPKDIYIDHKKCTDIFASHHHYYQGKKLQATVSLVSMKKHLADDLLDLFENMGISISKIMAAPYVNFLALREAMVLDQQVIMCHIGNKRVTVSYFEDDMLQSTRMFGLGSDNITKDIMEAFDIDWQMAEKLKCHYGFVLADSRLAKGQASNKKAKQQIAEKAQHDFVPEDMIGLLPRIITPRVEEIFEAVSDMIKDLPNTALVVLSGASSALPSIVTTARQYLHTRVLLPPQNMCAYNRLADDGQQQTDKLAILGMAYASYYQKMHQSYEITANIDHLATIDYDDLLKNNIKSTSSLDKTDKIVQESLVSSG